jgi:hypothetical protein
VEEVAVKVVDTQGDLDALRGLLNLAILVAMAAMVSLGMLFWKMRKSKCSAWLPSTDELKAGRPS